MKKALLVIDMQNDFIDGSLGTKEAQDILPNVIAKCQDYNPHDIIFTKDTHLSNYLNTLEGHYLPVKHCIANTDGWQIHPALDFYTAIGSNEIEKYSFGTLSWEDFSEYDEYELCGLCTDICVVSNALILRAMFPNKKIFVDASCCAGTTPEKHNAALEVMKSCQIEVLND